MEKFRSTAIPFGISASSGVEVDICDVERGLACECICPSCKAPLNAKKGEINEWHFAHSSKDGHKREVTDCEFSFFVSVRMMSRKILSMTSYIELPEGLVHAALNGQYHGKKHLYSLPYAKKSTFKPDSIQVETVWNSMHVDALLTLEEYQIAIFFRCPDKRAAYNYPANKPENTGVLEIDLTGCRELLYGQDRPKNVKFTTLLERFLIDNIDNKKWLFHPRKAKTQEAVDRLLKERISRDVFDGELTFVLQESGDNSESGGTNVREGIYQFRCVICHNKWNGGYVAGRFCQQCQSHLHVTDTGKI